MAQAALGTMLNLYVYWQATTLSHHDLVINFGAYQRLAPTGTLARPNLNNTLKD
jgi:hypothetical protein